MSTGARLLCGSILKASGRSWPSAMLSGPSRGSPEPSLRVQGIMRSYRVRKDLEVTNRHSFIKTQDTQSLGNFEGDN